MFENLFFIFKNIYGIVAQTREKKIAAILTEKHLKIATAESCSGGLISSRMVDLSGSSNYIFQNFVTYSNNSKIKLLNVNPETISKFGVVSEEVALQMAQGLLKNYECDIAIATTGIAGPTGGSNEKPVGLVYIAVANKEKAIACKFQADSKLKRRIMKYAFSNKALDLLLEFLTK